MWKVSPGMIRRPFTNSSLETYDTSGCPGTWCSFLSWGCKSPNSCTADDEIVGLEMLAAHDQHMMLGEGFVQRSAGFAVDRLREIEAGDLGAGVIRQRRNGEGCHERSLHANILFSERYRRTGVRVKQPHVALG